MNRFILYINTLRYLKWKQIFYRALYFLKRRSFPAAGRDTPRRAVDAPGIRFITSSFLPAASCYHKGAFTFLNISKLFQDDVDWGFTDYGKLWTYNLNYFEYLNQPDMSPEKGMELIRSFLAVMEKNRVGMEPYPISLRGMNWIRFLVQNGIRDEVADDGLYCQYLHLLHNLEYHLLGNHLLENGFSLLFGGVYFGNERFCRKSDQILREELAEQILSDGGHFERSPMYHQLILSRVLDCITLLKGDEGSKMQGMISLLSETAARMLGWLEQMTFRNGAIPLMNDSAFGVVPSTAVLAACAAKLDIAALRVPLGESGYRKIANDTYEAILDVGEIGPDYIPGHAHADTLSFELHVDGCPVIVDTGTSTYEENDLRRRQRSTGAHNTVEIDGEDSSEVWGSFRVARRARPLDLRIIEGKERIVSCAHDGYRRLPGKPVHRREWRFREGGLRIRDTITGGFKKAAGRLHFHPEVGLIPSSGDCKTGKIILPGGRELRWQIEKGLGCLSGTTWHPEFGLSVPNQCLEISFAESETVVNLSW